MIGCKKNPSKPDNKTSNIYTSFRNIPGVTKEEIKFVENIRKRFEFFVFGGNYGTELFIDSNGELDGFTVMFCDWLSDLFEMQFKPKIYKWDDLLEGLENGEVNFTGEMTATEERLKTYFMTGPIAQRPLISVTKKNSEPLSHIAKIRNLRYGFLSNVTTDKDIFARTVLNFEAIYINDYDVACNMLKNEEIDVFFEESPAEAVFGAHEEFNITPFFPLIFSPVSLTTQNKELEPFISIVNKALQNDGIKYLTNLYNNGYKIYKKNLLDTRLTEEERAYITERSVIPFAAENANYPICFYNAHKKTWNGIAIDLLKEIEFLTGLKFKRINNQDKEISNLLDLLASGEASIISELILTNYSDERFLWSETTLFEDDFALISHSELRNINVYEISYYKIALVKGTASSTLFRSWFPFHKDFIEYDNTNAAFNALIRGDVDMVMASHNKLLMLTNYRELPDYKINFSFNDNFKSTYGYKSTFGFNKDEVILRSIVDKALQVIDVESISEEWLCKTYDYKIKMMKMQIPWMIGGIVVLLIIPTILYRLRRQTEESKKLEKQVFERTAELEMQHLLASTINDTAALLLESNPLNYWDVINNCVGMIGRQIDVDSVCLWQCFRNEDGTCFYKRVCSWSGKEQVKNYGSEELAYQDVISDMEETLLRGEYVRKVQDEFSKRELLYFERMHVQSFVAVPMFLENNFWGFAGFYDCQRTRKFSVPECYSLYSWGLLTTSAIQRGIIVNDMQNTLAKLQTVVGKYAGVIWSVDLNGIITTFDGQLLSEIGIETSSMLGKSVDSVSELNNFIDIIKNAEKTFSEGAQNWSCEIDGRVLRSHTAQIKDTNGNVIGVVGSTDDVSESIRIQNDLAKAAKAAEAANKTKSAFLANMSHEIRTPMNSIIGFSELAISDDIPTKTKEYIDNISRSAKALLQIINDILDLSKIESGKMEIESIPFNLHDVLYQCKTVITHKAVEKNIILHFYAEPILNKKLLGDPTKLRQVLINLLSNSIKFTNVGAVKLSATAEDLTDKSCTIHFEVKDSGIGISSDELKNIFEPFVQADASITRKYGGTGLGLPITKNIVELMGGKITVESSPGIGSKFSFDIIFQTIDVNENEDGDGDGVEEIVEKPMFSDEEILVCEDNAMNQQVITEHLSRVGLRTVIAENGKIGIDLVKERKNKGEKPFSLIFMDMQMPVMDGLEAAPKIMELETQTPIVAMTANVMSNEMEFYRNAGMNDCVGKPFTTQELWHCLLKYITPANKAFAASNMHASIDKDADEKLHKRLLIDFVKDNKKKFDEIVEAINNDDIKLAHRLAHTLKSTAGLIGKISLQNAANDIEKMLKDGKDNTTKASMDILKFELNTVLKDLMPLLEKSVKLTKTTENLSEKETLVLIEKLEHLLKSGNPECLELSEKLNSIPGSENLIELMENFDFGPAAAALADLKKGLGIL
jgi:signal transduction histidine kinase/CheY-like chemotaxis protein/ABC-type amino acid transport substrate-binding protein